jgi:uncharacterized protein
MDTSAAEIAVARFGPPGTVTVTSSGGFVVCERCAVADTALVRMRGLLGRSSLEPGEGILLRPAPSIHTFFMRFAIDAVFLDPDLGVLEVRENIVPWRFAARRGARAVLELATGEVARRGIAPGQRLLLWDSNGG